MNKIVIPLNPIPASRPKVSKWGVYYGKNHTQFIKDVEDLYLNKTLVAPKEKQKGLFKVNTIYYCEIAKSTSKKKVNELDNTYCDKKIDLDNLDKLTRDEIMFRYIEDDCFIVDGRSTKVWSKNPRIEIKFSEIKKKTFDK